MSSITTTASTITTTATASTVAIVHGTEKKPRSIEQWEEVSFANTQNVMQMGANVPLAWVLVRGKNIPPNAIVAGEDKRRPLYIARTFWEGSVCIGQAGQHLTKGASFAYSGEEIHVDTYEVLVPLQQTITYRVADSHYIPSIPRMARRIKHEPLQIDTTFTTLVQKLKAVKVVVVIDDSISMEGQLWSQARSALAGLVSIVESDMETNGIDLCFLNNPTFETNIRDRRRIEHLFDSVCPQGATPTGQRLQKLFSKYIPLIESPNSNSPPIAVMVITDGVPTDNLESVIIDGARRLDRNHIAQHRFGVSFIQIGNDPDAADFLRELDDEISTRHGCRDMVTSIPYDPRNPEFTRDAFLKCVLGSINPYGENSSNLTVKFAPKPHCTSPFTPKSYSPNPLASKPYRPSPVSEFSYQSNASRFLASHTPVSPFASPRMAMRSLSPSHSQSQFSPVPTTPMN